MNQIIKSEIVADLIKSRKYSAQEIHEITGYNQNSITRQAKYMNQVIPRSNCAKMNHDFFKVWSKEMAWTVGFIAADGCVSKKGYNYRLSIKINPKDEEVLNNIKNFLECNKKLYYRRCFHKVRNNFFDSVTLDINSKIILEDLFNIGIHPRKSLTLKYPSIPKEYANHFARGFL
jgi:hypothetical protein